MGSNIVHQYFKKEFDGLKIIVKVDPIRFKGVELTVDGSKVESRTMDFDKDIFDDLKVDGFTEVGPIEFNLYQAGVL